MAQPASEPSRAGGRATHIRIEGARSHNLKGATCEIPLRALTVVTGVSGSGKSTLAFDTLYAEGQRRFVTSLSTYARQFLEQLPRPDVDFISNLPPAIAIERRNRVTGARSTVGTATEILDHLRLLWAKIGETRCPDCDRIVERSHPESVAGRIVSRFEGERLSIVAPIVRRSGERAGELRDRLLRDGHGRLLDATGSVLELEGLTGKRLTEVRDTAAILIDRLVPSAEGSRSRLTEAIAAAFELGDGTCSVVPVEGPRVDFLEGFRCDDCGRAFAEPRPALFSFNSPLGACATCQGFGRVAALDRERVVPDPTRSLAQGAVAPFATPSGRRMQARLLAAARELGIAVDRPYAALDEAERAWVFEGDGETWRGVQRFFARLERKRYKVQARVMIARYRRFDPCPDCDGLRLCDAARAVHVAGQDLGSVSRLTLRQLAAWLQALELAPGARERAERIVTELRARVGTAVDVGLDYITLDRPMRTLSGGEAQRIQLATALGGTLTASLYVLDEPSIGLHARDAERLVSVLRKIRDQGNTVVVVEHATEIVRAADHVLDLGPGAGRAGGQVVCEGSVEAIARHPESVTARALRGELARAGGGLGRARRAARGRIRIVGASEHNLQNLTVDIPLGQLVAVTGVSGAGKSSLIRSVLVGQLLREPERGACTRIEGGDQIAEVVVVDPHPPARSSRSNPATVSKAFDGIRRVFASTREARARGATPGWFSFNVAGGRCDACEGAGEVVVDMHFLDDIRVPCDACGGRRYREDALQIRVAGLSIADVLDQTVDQALDVFGSDPRITASLQSLVEVGLGYIALGQPLSTLSTGEIQRLRLAQALAQDAERVLFVLDEPTSGLHPADVDVLVRCLDRALDAGGSVIVVEHNLDVIRCADHIVDLGPEGGPGGGQVVVAGPPEIVAGDRHSHTAAALRQQGLAGVPG